jgi:hypothetical protein
MNHVPRTLAVLASLSLLKTTATSATSNTPARWNTMPQQGRTS